MSETIEERFYSLLPLVYRSQDYGQGQPLRALLAVLEGEYQALKDDMEATYDNWFVDTCDQWVLPYLADLLGIRGLAGKQHLFPTQRRFVANAIGYNRRKGTVAVLEHVIRDVTGWDARVVEFFQLLSLTQHLANVRSRAGRTVDLRDPLAMARIDGPFDRSSHTVEVRRNSQTRGQDWPDVSKRQARYHQNNLGLFFWRIRAYPIDDTFARRVGNGASPGSFTFDPLGRDVQLFNSPQAVQDIMSRTEAPNLPIPVIRELLAADLEAFAADQATGEAALLADCKPEGNQAPTVNSTYYGPDRSINISYRTGTGQAFQTAQPGEILVANLADWQMPSLEQADGTSGSPVVAVDPELGRMRFLGDDRPQGTGDVIVSYVYGFSADIGGGPYSRYEALQTLENLPGHALMISVASGGQSTPPPDSQSGQRASDWAAPSLPDADRPLRTLEAALKLWLSYCEQCAQTTKRPIGVIVIRDNGRYGDDSGESGSPKDLLIHMPPGAQLSLIAADRMRPTIGPYGRIKITTQADEGRRPVRKRKVRQEITEPPAPDRRLELNGLLFENQAIEVEDEEVEGFLDVVVRHCTVMERGIIARLAPEHAPALRVQIADSIVGPVRLPREAYELVVTDSILDPAGTGLSVAGLTTEGKAPMHDPQRPPVNGYGPPTTLQRVTVLGEARLSRLKLASDVIFARPVQVEDCENGLIRRSCLPAEGSRTPMREYCQPDLAIHDLRAASTDTETPEVLQARLNQQLRPRFTSLKYGHYGYAQLHPSTPREIRGGGEAGAEMGAFHNLFQLQREANLRRALDEYLPLGREVSVHYVT